MIRYLLLFLLPFSFNSLISKEQINSSFEMEADLDIRTIALRYNVFEKSSEYLNASESMVFGCNTGNKLPKPPFVLCANYSGYSSDLYNTSESDFAKYDIQMTTINIGTSISVL